MIIINIHKKPKKLRLYVIKKSHNKSKIFTFSFNLPIFISILSKILANLQLQLF